MTWNLKQGYYPTKRPIIKNIWHDLGETEKQFLDGLISEEERESQIERAWNKFVSMEDEEWKT